MSSTRKMLGLLAKGVVTGLSVTGGISLVRSTACATVKMTNCNPYTNLLVEASCFAAVSFLATPIWALIDSRSLSGPNNQSINEANPLLRK